ncbi:MAG: type II secretion system F family protein [Phycisphaerae bacterium]|nr:type II secretion system F family protein [Phycisphaerae bacterium]
MAFTFEAVDSTGREIHDVLEAPTAEEAMDQLHGRGLFVTKLSEQSDSSGRGGVRRRASVLSGRPGNTRDRMMLTQQMSMMLHAGSQIVPALAAIESQVDKPGWREILASVCHRVEDGAALSEAMGLYPQVFDEMFRTIVSAGESTGSTAEAFDRLAVMTKKQQEIKVRVIGALIYPAILLLMCLGVVGVLMFYVLPKFDDLYSMLGTKLPTLTVIMIDTSRWVTHNAATVAILAGLMIAGPIIALRLSPVRRFLDQALLRMPMISGLVRRLILARLFRVWGTLIHSSVPLLEGLRLSRSTTSNAYFQEMLDEVIHSVEEGNPVGESLARSSLAPPTMSSAITTGEQSGQLGESLLFLAEYLDDENTQTVATLTRLVEPFVLVIMGAVVGVIAVALFLPLFDLTSAVSGH